MMCNKAKGIRGAVCLFAALALAGCSDNNEVAGSPQPSQVHLFEVGSQAPASKRHFVGRVDAVSTVDMAFEVSGKLAELPVQQGQIVPEGNLLAALDPEDFQLALRQADAQYKQARTELERGRQLLPRGHISRSDMDGLETAYENASVQLANARRNLQYTRLEAPFDALVTRRIEERYASVQATQPVVRVQNVTELRVHVSVPEQLMRMVSGAEDTHRAYLQLDDGSLVQDPATSEPAPLAYREHATEVDPMTQTYRVSLGMPRPESIMLLPGMSVTVLVERRQDGQTGPAWIPASALVTVGDDTFAVWRFNESAGDVEQQVVVIGQFREGSVEVLSGLNVGDRIVSAGARRLQEGQSVQPFTGF